MKIFEKGSLKIHEFKINRKDLAKFTEGLVHPVCSTFALAREVEYASRLFVIEGKAEDEEGIGTFLEIKHIAPALLGARLHCKAEVLTHKKQELICKVDVFEGAKLLASCRTGQKVLKKEQLKKIFSSLKKA